MPLSSNEQSLFDHAKTSLPRWLTSSANAALEWLFAFTEIFDAVRAQGQTWLDSTYILKSTGSALDQHAADRGTSRQMSEGDPALQQRLIHVSDALTEPALKTGIDAMLDSAGLLAQLRIQHYTITGWNLVLKTKHTLSGGGFQTETTLQTVSDGTNPPTLVETDNATVIHFSAGVTTRTAIETLITASSTQFSVETSSSSGATTLAAGDAFGPVSFYLSAMVSLRRDRGHFHTVGNSKAFMSRGYRMCNINRPMGYIFILPYGTDAATGNAASEYLRKNGPGGYAAYIERRVNP